MLPDLIPGAKPLYSSKDIIQNATTDLHALSRTLHRTQANREFNCRTAARNNALRSKIHDKDEYIEGMQTDIVRNVQTVSKSIQGGCANELLASVLELEDHVKFDTKRMRKMLQQLHAQMRKLDDEIADLMLSDDNYSKFRCDEQQRLLKLSSLESQLSLANRRFSISQGQVRQLKVDLCDFSQTNQIFRQKLDTKTAAQMDLRNRICSLFSNIERVEKAERELQSTLTSLISSSEKLESLCQNEWSHVMTVVAEKSAIEDRVRRFRSGDLPIRCYRTKDLVELSPPAVQPYEIDRICKIWAQCTWSNAIDTIKIESAMVWLERHQRDWKLITTETGMHADSDALCEWFAAREEHNILRFEEVRQLIGQRKRILDESLALRTSHRDVGKGTASSSIALNLSQRIEKQKSELECLEEERTHMAFMLDEIKGNLSKIILTNDAESNLASNLPDTLTALEQWTKQALMELYGPEAIPDAAESGNDELIPLQIEPPDIGQINGSISDEDESI